MRNDAKIPAKTRVRIQEAARALNYRPNPRVASLMAHIRGAQSRESGERIAYVWVHTTRADAAKDPFLQRVYTGAKARAQQAGFALEEFWTNDGMNPRRLQQVIVARGIVGVVLSPVTTNEVTVSLDWDWSAFAAAVIGNVSWTPELHHAVHHHYLGMRRTLLELARLGCNRPLALIEAESNERAKRAWEGAFLTHHASPSRARSQVRIVRLAELDEVADWVESNSPDALIVSAQRIMDAPGLRGLCRRLRLPITTLYWDRDPPGIGGIDQSYEKIAAHAVDLVIAQLNSNETGVPEQPSMMLFPGIWIPPRVPGRSKLRKAV